MHPEEQEEVRKLLNVVISEGKTYPQKQPLSPSQFAAYWLNQDAFVIRTTTKYAIQQPKEIWRAFYLKPNFPGRCSHICNAGFIVQPDKGGSGILQRRRYFVDASAASHRVRGSGKGDKGENNTQCPMPNAQYPIPNTQCPIPNAQCPMPFPRSLFPDPFSPIPDPLCNKIVNHEFYIQLKPVLDHKC